MKQCPTCNRTYEDISLSYCLDDGSFLSVAYDPQATQRVVPPRSTSPARTEVLYGEQTRPQAPRRHVNKLVYVIIALLVVGISGGALAIILVLSRTEQPQTPPISTVTDKEKRDTAVVDDRPTATSLVGTWRANVDELGNKFEINYTFNPDGTSSHYFIDVDGKSAISHGTWRYSDGTLFETYPDGASGKGTIDWTDSNAFTLTIIDNGVPAYNGIKRRYERVQ